MEPSFEFCRGLFLFSHFYVYFYNVINRREGSVLGPRFLNRLLNMLTGDMGVGHNFSKTRHGANENWDLRIKKKVFAQDMFESTFVYI